MYTYVHKKKYLRTDIHTHIRTYIHIFIHACIRMHAYIRTHTYIHNYAHKICGISLVYRRYNSRIHQGKKLIMVYQAIRTEKVTDVC